MTTDLTLEIDDQCQRCGHNQITDDGKCRKCGFKCWHAFH